VREVLGSGLLGVITSDREHAAVTEALDAEGLSWSSELQAASTPIVVLGAEAAKGLEFDNVVAVEPAQIAAESPQSLRALFVALTRPTRRLTLIHAEPLPKVLGLESPLPDDVAAAAEAVEPPASSASSPASPGRPAVPLVGTNGTGPVDNGAADPHGAGEGYLASETFPERRPRVAHEEIELTEPMLAPRPPSPPMPAAAPAPAPSPPTPTPASPPAAPIAARMASGNGIDLRVDPLGGLDREMADAVASKLVEALARYATPSLIPLVIERMREIVEAEAPVVPELPGRSSSSTPALGPPAPRPGLPSPSPHEQEPS
jgi:hypothetical protein